MITYILLYFCYLIDVESSIIKSSDAIAQQSPEIINPDDDCAVTGVYSPDSNAFELTFQINQNSVNRGTDSNGTGTLRNDGRISIQKHLGKPNRDNFEPEDGNHANGHDRYTTCKENNTNNAQPAYAVEETGAWEVSLAHNGNLEIEQIRAQLRTLPEGTSDSALMAQLFVESPGSTWPEKIKNAYPHLNGSFSNVMLTPEGLYGFRDLRGNRPLWLSRHSNGTITLTSETYPVDQLPQGEEYHHEPVEIGELIHIDLEGKVHRIQLFSPEEIAKRQQAFCLEEIVYLHRGESLVDVNGEMLPVDELRRRAGKRMREEEQILDFSDAQHIGVAAIPRGGTSYTEGFAGETKEKPKLDTFNLLVKIVDERSFISTGDQQGVAKKKLVVDTNEVTRFVESGKRDLVLVDDSLIRGNMIKPTLEMLRNAFTEAHYEIPRIHIRICSPEVLHPCGLGIAINHEDELLYNREKDVCEALGVTSIQHISHEGILEAFKGKDATEALQSLGLAYIGLGYCMNCMRKDGFVHPIEWFNKDDHEQLNGIPLEEGSIFSSRKEDFIMQS